MKTSSSLAGSHNYASHTQQQESDSARKMRDTSGRKCLEQLERLSHVGSWAKTFTALLIGQEGWCSTKCRLTWKLKGTKYNRIYCQLYPSTLHIEETGFGLLPTPTLMDSASNGDMSAAAKMMKGATHRSSGQQIQKTLTMAIHEDILRENPALIEELAQKDIQKRENLPTQEEFVGWIRSVTNAKDLSKNTGIQLTKVEHWFRRDKAGFSYPSIQEWEIIRPLLNPTEEMNIKMTTTTSRQWMGMLPTPNTRDWKDNIGNGIDAPSIGVTRGYSLGQKINSMLPTPMASDCGDKVTGLETQDSLVKIAREATGVTSQLSPLFVLEMMGFPTDWTALPFLNGETSQSKQEVMQ